MKKRAIHIISGFIIAAAMALPSCDLLEECGNCELVTVDNDGNISYGTPEFVCGETYKEYNNSEITYGPDGSHYWSCE